MTMGHWRTDDGIRAVVIEKRGFVHISRDGVPIEEGAASPLLAGAVVTTEANSRLSLKIGTHRVHLEAASRLELSHLHEDSLTFRLERGDVGLEVTPLTPNQRLTVETRRVTVTVVGTFFRVEERDRCTRVSVTKGRVKTTTKQGETFIEGGEARRFCDGDKGAVPEDQAVPAFTQGTPPVRVTDKRHEEPVGRELLEVFEAPGHTPPHTSDGPKGARPARSLSPEADTLLPSATMSQGNQRTFNPVPPIVPPQGNTEGEKIYEAAHEAIMQGDIDEADRLLAAYLQRHPNGDLVEDALFRRVRLAYRQRRSDDVCTIGEQFLDRYPQSGHRVSEVRILCAESALAAGGKSDRAHRMLAPLVRGLGGLSERQRQQVTYLQFRAACKESRGDECREWSARYLERYPEGRFAGEAENNLKRMGP